MKHRVSSTIFKAFALVLALLICAAGCNEATSARDAVERFRTAMNENDYKTAFAYVADYDGFGFDDDAERLINAVASSLNINIISESGSATNAMLEADITTIDLRDIYCEAANAVIPQYYNAVLAGETISSQDISSRMMQEVMALAESGSAPTVTSRVALTLTTNADGKWVIRMDVTTYNAITGYLDEANNLITTGTIVQAINGESDFLSGSVTPQQPVSPTDVSGSDVSGADVQ